MTETPIADYVRMEKMRPQVVGQSRRTDEQEMAEQLRAIHVERQVWTSFIKGFPVFGFGF